MGGSAIKTFRSRTFVECDSAESCKKPINRRVGLHPNDGHVHGGGMDCLSEIFGTEFFRMAILVLPIKTDRVQARPEPERWSCPWRRHGLAINNFRGRKFLDGDSVGPYKN